MRRILILAAGLIILLVIGTGIWAVQLERDTTPEGAALFPAVPAAETFEPAAENRGGTEEPATIPPEAISFLDSDIDHAFFPLAGGHDLACESCHTAGRFANTPAVCTACHETPDDHFPGECTECHVINDWTPFQFNHIGVTSCTTCHEADAPPDHFPGQCANCHTSTDDWRAVSFNHNASGAFSDCASCHTNDAPPNHFPGQCSTCHTSTADWSAVDFSHTFPLDHGRGANQSCQTCHTTDSYNTYTCYNCHEHDPQDIREEHVDEDIFDFEDCVACHPTGREEEFDDD